MDKFCQDELAAVNQTDMVPAFVTEGLEGLEGLGVPTANGNLGGTAKRDRRVPLGRGTESTEQELVGN